MAIADQLFEQIRALPTEELGRVAEFCNKQMVVQNSKEEAPDPLEAFFAIMDDDSTDGSAVNDDPRLAALLDKHGSKS